MSVHRINRKYKRIGISIFLLMSLFVIYKLNITRIEPQKIKAYSYENDVATIYEGFLEGKVCATDKNKTEYLIEELLEDKSGMYAYCDIDNDGQKELHIKSEKHFYTLKVRDSELIIIYDGSIYNSPVNENGLSGILYYRPGGAPKHDTYGFITFDGTGEIIEEVVFEWYDDNENGIMDKSDFYFWNDCEIDMEEWESKTRKYAGSKNATVLWQNWDI